MPVPTEPPAVPANPSLALGHFDLDMFTDRAAIKRLAAGTVRDPSGGVRPVYSLAAPARRCHREDATPQLVPDLATLGNRVNALVYFPPPDPGLRAGDIIDLLSPTGEVVEHVTVVRQRREGLNPASLYRVDGSSRD